MTETAPEATHAPEPALDSWATPVPVANAALVGVPAFLIGSISLTLVLIGYVPPTLAGAPIAIIALAAGLGQTIATIFALRAGESAIAGVFGIFAGFWLSYAALVLGILHNWYGFVPAPAGSSTVARTAAANAAAANIQDAQKGFLLSWLILIVLLTVVSLRLPLAFSVVFAFVDLTLLFVFLGVVNASEVQTKVGGYFSCGVVIGGAYVFLDAMTVATGGKNLPLGKPLLH